MSYNYVVFMTFLMTQVIFPVKQPEILPFLTIIQFYRKIEEKRVGRSPQEI